MCPFCVRAAPASGASSLIPVEGTLRLRIEYEPGEDGWVIAQIPAVPGAMSQGRTREEARENVLDALQLLLSPEPTSESTEAESVELTVVR
jgi:predicted RNase H-like HicB family nuclease